MKFSDIRRFKDGDPLTPAHLNAIVEELRRWRKMAGSGPVDVIGADGSSPPIISGYPPGAQVIPAICSAGFTAGSISSPTSASVTLLVPNATSASLTATGGSTETAYHVYGKAITGSATKVIWLVRFNGLLYTLTADC